MSDKPTFTFSGVRVDGVIDVAGAATSTTKLAAGTREETEGDTVATAQGA